MAEEGSSSYTVAYVDDTPEDTNWLKRAGLVKIGYGNGDVFEGQINEGKQKEGKGKYIWMTTSEDGEVSEQASYDGEYIAGQKQGLGKMKFPNGDSYHGMWNADKMNGEGTMVYANGDIFSGKFVEGIPEGQGTYEFQKDQSQLVGKWKQGQIVSGTWRFADGSQYEGQFDDGKPLGTGSYQFTNGLRQCGEYAKIDSGEEGAPFIYQWVGGSVAQTTA